MAGFIPLSIPNFEGNESKYVNDALAQGWVSTGGAYITRLEKDLAKFLNVEDVAACQSGTSGIHLALIESGVNPEDMVIVPTLTFIAAVNPVRYQFAEPVFMDCDDSLCMDPQKVLEFCETQCSLTDKGLIHKNSGKRVKAVIVVHVFGNLADMEAIMDIANRFKLIVIEDATEALGTYYTEGIYKGMYAGTIGDFGAYSFNGNKIITTGGGGAITAKDRKSVEHIRYLSTQAKDDSIFYIHNEIGYNYRMTNLQAALGVAQVEELSEFIKRKNENYSLYKELFQGVSHITMLEFRKGTRSNKWFYSLQFEKEWLLEYMDNHDTKEPIKHIVNRLGDLGVQTRPVWGLIHDQLPYNQYIAYNVTKASLYADTILNIPCSTQLKKEDISCVVDAVRNIL